MRVRIIINIEMEPEQQQAEKVDVKLYVYGGRESDQFWLPDARSYSRKPFCLSDLPEFKIVDEDDPNKNQIIPNPFSHKTVYKVACGGLHSVVLTTDGQVYTFGCNDEGALGRQGTECVPMKVELEDPIDMISAGDNHSIFANSVNGAIYTTGNYNYLRGQKMKQNSIRVPEKIFAQEINISNKNKKIQKIASGANHNCVLIGGKVFCRGEPEALTIGRRSSKRHKVDNSLTFNGVNLSNIEDIECGGYHTVAKVQKKGKLHYYAWGTNTSGQLGIGSYESQAYPVEIKKLRNKRIKQMAGGANFTLFLSEEGQLYGCGTNEYGSLGLGQGYKYEDSDEEMEDRVEQSAEREMQQLEQNVEENLKLTSEKKEEGDGEKSERIEENQEKKETPEKQQKQEEPQQKEEQIEEEKPKLNLQANVYIKTIKQIKTPQPITNIAAGSDFSLAWNNENLYTWGFGTGYVLLNGSEEEQYEPFKVKSTIINNHRIYNLQAGGQHVLYTSHPKEGQVEVKQEEKVWQSLSKYKRLRRKK